jgi:hypothetical protein
MREETLSESAPARRFSCHAVAGRACPVRLRDADMRGSGTHLHHLPFD